VLLDRIFRLNMDCYNRDFVFRVGEEKVRAFKLHAVTAGTARSAMFGKGVWNKQLLRVPPADGSQQVVVAT